MFVVVCPYILSSRLELTSKDEMKKEYKTITEFDWWKNKSTSRGLPKDHPFLNRENDVSISRKVIKEKADTAPENPHPKE